MCARCKGSEKNRTRALWSLYCTASVGPWINRRDRVNGTRRTRIKRLREHQYRERYTRCLLSRRVGWGEESNVEHRWERVKRASKRGTWLSESEKETKRVCGGMLW